jgi:hypothetical protein
MTTFKALADQLETDTDDLREFIGTRSKGWPAADEELSDFLVNAIRDGWQTAKMAADDETAKGLTYAADDDEADGPSQIDEAAPAETHADREAHAIILAESDGKTWSELDSDERIAYTNRATAAAVQMQNPGYTAPMHGQPGWTGPCDCAPGIHD